MKVNRKKEDPNTAQKYHSPDEKSPNDCRVIEKYGVCRPRAGDNQNEKGKYYFEKLYRLAPGVYVIEGLLEIGPVSVKNVSCEDFFQVRGR